MSQPTTLYAATEDDGVWRSTNVGLTGWEDVSEDLKQNYPGAQHVRTVYASGSTIYAGTSVGLFKSNGGNGGWQPVAQGPEIDPKKPTKLNKAVQAVFSGPATTIAGVASGGVYRSTDGGSTWTPPAPGNGMSTSETVWSFASFVDGVIYAATGSGVYVSTDFGATWTLKSDGITGTVLRVMADDKWPNIYYAYGTDGVFRSYTAGLTWTQADRQAGLRSARRPGPRAAAVLGRQVHPPLRRHREGRLRRRDLQQPATGRHQVEAGRAGVLTNSNVWALANFKNTPGTLLAGTQNNGGYGIVFVAPIPKVKPAVTGTLQVGKTLTATDGDWDGTETIEYAYQWQYCTGTTAGTCHDIADATNKTYVLTGDEQGDRMRVLVTASNDFPTFDFDEVASDITGTTVLAAAGTVAGSISAPAPTLSVNGQPQPGKPVTANPPSFLPQAATFSYRWYRCDKDQVLDCDPIEGAVGPGAYVLTDEDVDFRVCATATGTASGANPGSTTSECGSALEHHARAGPCPDGSDHDDRRRLRGRDADRGRGRLEVPGHDVHASVGVLRGRRLELLDDLGRQERGVPRQGRRQGPSPARAHQRRLQRAAEPAEPEGGVLAAERRDHRPARAAGRSDPGAHAEPEPEPAAHPAGDAQPDTVAPVLQSLGAVSAMLKPGAQLKLKVGLTEGGTLSRRRPARPRRPQVGQDLQGRRQEGQEVHRYLEGCELQAQCGRVGHSGPAQEEARRR